jgi:hypothetical protein
MLPELPALPALPGAGPPPPAPSAVQPASAAAMTQGAHFCSEQEKTCGYRETTRFHGRLLPEL